MCIFLIYSGISLAIKSISFSSQALLCINPNILTSYKCQYHMLQVPVNYHGNSSCDECTYQPYVCKVSPIFKRKLMWKHDACTINQCIHIDFCECDTHAILPTIVLGSIRLTPIML